jgi:hypothetical protein
VQCRGTCGDFVGYGSELSEKILAVRTDVTTFTNDRHRGNDTTSRPPESRIALWQISIVPILHT